MTGRPKRVPSRSLTFASGVPICVCICTTRAATSGPSCTRAAPQRVRGLQCMAALDAPPALRAVADLDVEAPHNGPHHREVLLILRRDALHCDRAAAIRTLGRQRCLMDFVDLRLPPPARLPPRTAHRRAVQDVCHNPAAALWRRAPPGGNPRAAPRQAAAGAVRYGASSDPGRARCASDPRAVGCSHAPVVRCGCPADPAPAGMQPGHWTAAARAYRGYRLRSTAPAVRSTALLP